jgi:hypothetical protein
LISDNGFYIQHIIVMSQPGIELIGTKQYHLNIFNITVICSKEQIGFLVENETIEHPFKIYNYSTGDLVKSGNLSWSQTTNSWQAMDINLTGLTPGEYYTVCKFGIFESENEESIYLTSEKLKFILPSSNDISSNNDKNHQPGFENCYIILVLAIIFIIIILFFIIMLFRIRSKY